MKSRRDLLVDLQGDKPPVARDWRHLRTLRHAGYEARGRYPCRLKVAWFKDPDGNILNIVNQ
jgi:hypothetical protein